jgi:TRAP-type C4-dicarboxylate transport system permease large subunit
VASNTQSNRSFAEWFSSLPACILLFLVVLFSTSSDIHNQILQVGEHFWPGYYKLRVDPVQPSCDPNINVEETLKLRIAQNQEDDGFGLDLFDAAPIDPDLIRTSIENARLDCVNKVKSYEEVMGRITPSVEAFRSVELFVSELIGVGLVSQKFILVSIILLCAMTATMRRHHIAMRPVLHINDHYASGIAQIVANSILLVSSIAFQDLAHSDGTKIAPEESMLHNFWVYGLAVLLIVSIYNLFKVPKTLEKGGSIGHALLSMPLYATMAIITAAFFFSQGHTSAIGIYLNKLMDLADMFLNVGLYVWVGMLLKQTRFAGMVLALFKPWKMPPEMLAFFVVVLAAIPTAYTGGSGIFVIAAGAVIYHEIRASGARRNLALAATAMSGSMGVVLRPCLLVVVIAFMNREVTTDQLFGWGVWVFALSAMMFFVMVMFVNRQSKIQLASVGEAFPEMLSQIRPLLPYIICMVGVVFFYNYALNVKLDEFSAARILPVMMLAILVYEHITKKEIVSDDGKSSEPHKGLEYCVRTATNQTTAEIGALLLLVSCSICLGGMIERSGIVEMFPSDFANVWTAMTVMVLALVAMGMIMEAFGAVILVSQTIATIAYANGIDPIHFWMVTLVAFELGYLSPPVALNHLLARQVVGEEEVLKADADVANGTFYQRYERILMPMMTMGAVLLLVAYGPLIYQAF